MWLNSVKVSECMTTLYTSKTVDVNKFAVIRNMLCAYEWHHKDKEETLIFAIEHDATDKYIVHDMDRVQIMEFYKNYIIRLRDDYNYCEREIEGARKRCIKPSYRTIKSYLREGEELNMDNVYDFQAALSGIDFEYIRRNL